MNAVLYPLAAIVAWSAAAYKVPAAIRRPRDKEVITLTVALSVLGVVFTISTPAVWRWIDHVATWPNLSVLLSQACVMIWTVIVPGPALTPARTTIPLREEAAREQLSGELDWLVALARAVKRHPVQVTSATRETEPSRYA